MQRFPKSIQTLVLSTLALSPVMAFAASSGVLPESVRSSLSGTLTWHDGSGGGTTRAREETLIKDFVTETGLKVRGDFNSDMTKFFAAMDGGGRVPWSMIEFPTKGDFLKARDAGYLQKLDPRFVDTSKLREGSYDEYGVDVMRYGIVFTYNTDKFKGAEAPTGVRDLFDTKRFPGKRCLFKYPQFGGVLESALIADGVTPAQLYPIDADRAFKKLDSIKSDIVWWSNGDDAIRLMSSGECSMGIAWSGRVYGAVKQDKAPLAIKWQDSLYAEAVYAVPKGAPNADAGQAMIGHWILDVEGQKAFVKKATYTTDVKALDKNAYGEDMTSWIVEGENQKTAIHENAEFYAKNIASLVERFNRWISLK
ncbi:extracellular solute-binding protein [Pseudomonas sp. B21-056]|uniref:extracellular solute-binding protein n=1 Tax=Pseudomonas sp. B21-056 TaxID=2895495 RepID=UPI002231BB89|nr:extracellular solute-binding protein [Pseudomonas sp. B21-056]UZE26368.1 extracellular solute-binding protein [Pseudomonas sp. B21-056]